MSYAISAYDAWLATPPQRDIPDNHIQCKQCGEAADRESLTELQDEYEVCSAECLSKQLQDRRRISDRMACAMANVDPVAGFSGAEIQRLWNAIDDRDGQIATLQALLAAAGSAVPARMPACAAGERRAA